MKIAVVLVSSMPTVHDNYILASRANRRSKKLSKSAIITYFLEFGQR